VRCDSLDAAVIESPLEELLSRAAGRAVHGLLGYSFLRRYRVVVDYPNRVLWLASRRDWNDRPWEYSTVGVQLERRDGDARIAALVEGSPADEAGVRAGDVLLAVDGGAADSLDIAALARRLEGPPGSTVELALRRGTREWTLRLARRGLL
jgi:S1-C subfamily serine protease